jgi:EmrB/QacA subfamily drug resistance transporter
MTRNAKIFATVGVGLALFLAALDQTIVGTALPRIVSELHGLEFYAWVATGYMVTSTTLTPIAGKLGDLFGRKPFLLAGMIGFVLASALCGQAQDMTELVAFRAIQGIFGGVLFASVFATLADLFPPHVRARMQGIFGGIFGLASIVGPTIGGYLTDNVGWRWVFYVNVPVGVLAVLAVIFFIPRTKHESSWRDIDFVGAVLLAVALVPMLIAFSITRDHDIFSVEVLGLLAFSAVAWIAFFFVERREAHPMVPFELFKNRTFAVSSIVGFLVAFGMFGAILYVNLIYQGVLGIPATNSGLLITPLMVGMIIASIITGQLMVRITRYRYIGTVGMLVMTGGLYLLSQIGVSSSERDVVVGLVLVGVGMGSSMPLYINAVQSALPRHFLGVASSQIQFWRNIGGTVGTAILGAVLSHQLPLKIQDNVAALNLPPQFSNALPQGSSTQAIFDPTQIAALRAQIPPQFQSLFEQVIAAVRQALAATTHEVFVYATAIVAIAVVASVFLTEAPLKARTPRQQQDVRDAEAREEVPSFGD